MTIQTIEKSIIVNASKEQVWEVLVNDKFNRIWFEEFSVGTHAITDWQVDSKVVFEDTANSGLIGKVMENKPGKILSVMYEGVLTNGVEDYNSEMATFFKGAREIYRLHEKNGQTTLDIKSDMGDEYFDFMSAAWDKALEKIKQLAEGEIRSK